MQNKSATRLGRWFGMLGAVVIGGVFACVLWAEGHGAFGAMVFVLAAALGLYVLFASDETLERTPWWLFW
nr:hypothetical protein [uncultured Albidiferax sp.]